MDNYYVAAEDDTLKNIAQKLGISYARLLKYNPQWKDGVPKGASIVLVEENNDEEKTSSSKEESTSSKKENGTTGTDEKKEEQKTDATANELAQQANMKKIKEAEAEYQEDKAALDESLLKNEEKLVDGFRKSSAKSESDLVAQKLNESSVADEKRRAIAKEYSLQRESLMQDYDEKVKKLGKTLAAIKNKNIK